MPNQVSIDARSPQILNDQELRDQIEQLQNILVNVTPDSDRQGFTSGSLYRTKLQQRQEELAKRQQIQDQAKQEQQFAAIFGSGGGGGQAVPQAPVFDEAAYTRELQESAGNQRKSIDDIFNNQQALGLQGLGEQYNPARKQAIEEAAVLGNLRSPAFQSTTLANMDAARGRDTSNFLAQLGQGRGQAMANLEQGLAGQLQQGRQFGANLANNQNQFGQNLGFQRANAQANLLQQGNQFGRNFGLQERQFNSNQSQQGLENAFNQQGYMDAARLGQMQADAQKKSGWDTFGQIAGGLGNLAGGFGGLLGGLSSFSKNGGSRRAGVGAGRVGGGY